MDKYLITQKTANPITGPIMVTTSPRFTCPLDCAFRKGGKGEYAGVCYAEHGALGAPGKALGPFPDVLAAVENLAPQRPEPVRRPSDATPFPCGARWQDGVPAGE